MSTRWVGTVAVWVMASGVALGQMVPPVCAVPGARRAVGPRRAGVVARMVPGAFAVLIDDGKNLQEQEEQQKQPQK